MSSSPESKINNNINVNVPVVHELFIFTEPNMQHNQVHVKKQVMVSTAQNNIYFQVNDSLVKSEMLHVPTFRIYLLLSLINFNDILCHIFC